MAGDWINVRRDPTMIFAFVFAAFPGALLWWFQTDIRQIGDQFLEWKRLDTALVPFALCLPPVLIGWVIGFLFLEERDDGPLEAISVTPVGRNGILRYRLGVAWFSTAVLTFINCVLLLGEISTFLQITLSIFVGAEAAIIAVFLPMIAKNKVEGLAMTKVFNVAAIIPLIALLPTPFKLFAGVIPTFWIGEIIYDNTRVLPLSMTLVLAGAVHAAVLVFALRRCDKRVDMGLPY